MKTSKELSTYTEDTGSDESREELLQSTDKATNETNKKDPNPSNANKNYKQYRKIKFFGFKFMSIWVFPMAALGILIEFLIISPIKGTIPFD